jgi:uncharacterized Fe-S cluster-containing radical SAM superfamily protein
MSLGFQITQDDIRNVLNNYQVKYTKEQLEEISSLIDDGLVEEVAISIDFTIDFEIDFNDEEILNKQTDAAYDEIARQLYELNYISKEQIEIYGNIKILE